MKRCICVTWIHFLTLEFWDCTFSFGRTAIEIVSVGVDTVDLVPSFSRESLNSYSAPVFVVVDQRVVPAVPEMAIWRPYKCAHNSTAGVDYSTAPENFPHDASRASDKRHKTHTLTHVGGKFPTPQRCTSHTWPNHPERVRIFYSLWYGEFPNNKQQQQQYSSLPVQSSPPSADCSLWHIQINTQNGTLWRNKNRHENRTMSGQFTRDSALSEWPTSTEKASTTPALSRPPTQQF